MNLENAESWLPQPPLDPDGFDSNWIIFLAFFVDEHCTSSKSVCQSDPLRTTVEPIGRVPSSPSENDWISFG